MKKYFKCIVGSILSALFLTQVLPSFAATFDEPRKVLLSKYSNAVYRDLSVRDTLYMNFDVNSVEKSYFLMEVGQRPRYFWDSNLKYHLLQNQTLNIKDVKYVDSTGSNGVLSIFKVLVPDGVFMGTDMSIDDAGGEVYMQGNDTNFLINNRKLLKAKLNLQGEVSKFMASVHNLSFSRLGNQSNYIVINNLFLRDFAYTVTADNKLIPFPSPRAMIYDTSSGSGSSSYKLVGSSTKFALKDFPTKTIKSYYGAWGLVSPTNVSTSLNSCTGGNRCYKYKYETNARGGALNTYTDTDSSEFVCAGEVYPGGASAVLGHEYDPGNVDSCYDYQLIQMPENTYDSNGSVYEFKVQEILQKRTDGIIGYKMVSQVPAFRVRGGDEVPEAISTNINDNWQVSQGSTGSAPRYAIVGGNAILLADAPVKVSDTATYNEICFMLCEGKLCTQNKAYIRQTREGGETATRATTPPTPEPSPITPPDPPQGGAMYVFTYTVGVCRKQTAIPQNNNNIVNPNYTNQKYEINFEPNDVQKLIPGLVLKTGSNYAAPKTCVRRVVKCNRMASNNYNQGRSYKFLVAE